MATWYVDGIAMTPEGVCEAAAEYGCGSDDPREAAKTLRAWAYKVKEPAKDKAP